MICSICVTSSFKMGLYVISLVLEIFSLQLVLMFPSTTAEVQCSSTSESVASVNTIIGHRLETTAYTTIRAGSPTSCMQRCQQNGFCLSVNYNLLSCQCEMNKRNRYLTANQLVPSAFYLYMERLPAIDPCTFRPCFYNGVCKIKEGWPDIQCACQGGFRGQYCQECEEKAVGLSDGIRSIPNANFNASSSKIGHPPSMARLNGSMSWIPRVNSAHEFLEVTLPRSYHVTIVALQGDTTSDFWITSFKLDYKDGLGTWTVHSRGPNHQTVFPGPITRNKPVENRLDPPIDTTGIRILPQHWNTQIAARIELYGCQIPD